MVRLEEVEDEAFTSDQAGPIEEEGDWDTDDGTRACFRLPISNTNLPICADLQTPRPPPSPPMPKTLLRMKASTTALPPSKT